MADILFSYSHKDKDRAHRILQAVGRKWEVWWDSDLDVVARASLRDSIEGELAAAKIVLVLWTPSSIASTWVRDEARFGLAYQKLIQLADGVNAPDLPEPFGEFVYVDVAAWTGEWDHPVLDGLKRSLIAECGPGVDTPHAGAGNFRDKQKTASQPEDADRSARFHDHRQTQKKYLSDIGRYASILVQTARLDVRLKAEDTDDVVGRLESILYPERREPRLKVPRTRPTSPLTDPKGGYAVGRPPRRGPGKGDA